MDSGPVPDIVMVVVVVCGKGRKKKEKKQGKLCMFLLLGCFVGCCASLFLSPPPSLPLRWGFCWARDLSRVVGFFFFCCCCSDW